MGSGPSLALTVCPLTGVPYVDPVKAPDGFTYSRRAIEAWIATTKSSNGGADSVRSPVTREWMLVPSNASLVKDEDARNAVLQAFSGSMFLGQSPQAAVARTLEGKINSVYDLNRCFAVVDSLSDLLVRVLDTWEPPKLVVIGDENAGKSTLLERLLMMSLFPHSEKVCTRARIHVRLRHTMSQRIPQLSVVDAKTYETTDGPWLIAAENGHLMVQEEMRRLVEKESGHDGKFVALKHIIVLDIEGPHLPSIDLIDLPGLVQAPAEAAAAARELVAAQIEEYRESSLFMAVVPSYLQTKNASAMAMIQQFGLESSTLGVFTHCDELPPARREKFHRWLTNPAEHGFDDGHLPLEPYGWVATSNPPLPKHTIPDKILQGKEQLSHGNLLRLQKQAQLETDDFYNQGFGTLVESNLAGAGALQHQLHKMFSKYMLKRWAPLTLFRLSRERARLQYELAGLGFLARDFRNFASGMREKAVEAASIALRKEVDVIAHAMAQKVYLPLNERVTALLSSDMDCLIEDLHDKLSLRSLQLRDICKEAADKIAPSFIACVETAMMRDADMPIWPSVEAEELVKNPPFVLSRFPQFIELIVARMNELLAPWSRLLVDHVHTTVEKILADASPFYKVTVRLRARPPKCRVEFNTTDIMAAIMSTFVQYSATLMCEQIAAGFNTIAENIDEWVEPKKLERANVLQKISDIDRASRDLKELLGGQHVVPEDLAELESISLARCICRGVGMSQAWVNKEAKFTIFTKDHDDNPRNLPPGHYFDVDVCIDGDRPVLKVKLENCAVGVYIGEYKLTREACIDTNAGLMSLRIELHGNSISGSPFPLKVAPEPRWTSSLIMEGQSSGAPMKFPVGLAIDADEIYVADMDQQQVHIFGSKDHERPGKFLRSLLQEGGSAESKLQQPWGIAVDKSDVFVTDRSNCCVKLFSKDDGSFLQIIGSVGTGIGELNDPHGLALDGDDVYVADSGNHRIQVFRKKGPGSFVPLATFGQHGSTDECLQSPCCMVVVEEHLHVVDKGSRRVKVFRKKEGVFVRSYGQKVLENPIGIALGGPYIYVADSTSNYICVFDKADGSFIRAVGSRGSADGEFREPGYIVVSGQYLYVAEKGNKRVQVFY